MCTLNFTWRLHSISSSLSYNNFWKYLDLFPALRVVIWIFLRVWIFYPLNACPNKDYCSVCMRLIDWLEYNHFKLYQWLQFKLDQVLAMRQAYMFTYTIGRSCTYVNFQIPDDWINYSTGVSITTYYVNDFFAILDSCLLNEFDSINSCLK